jgi:hypothetical protein
MKEYREEDADSVRSQHVDLCYDSANRMGYTISEKEMKKFNLRPHALLFKLKMMERQLVERSKRIEQMKQDRLNALKEMI